ncbi:tyrosinase family protein [Sorangium sp. So ce1000]|uniref:tyrosinase family protein n=1 Tax=Sorangium sp. So ce1000 TaxID=3133325 RepID=UPI003F5FBF2C
MTTGIRQSIYVLQQEYAKGNTKPLEDVLYAWRGIQRLNPREWNSFFALGGLHGEPFLLRRAVDRLPPEDTYAYWGGYCNHGNILFPTWHRAYLYCMEKALQSIVPGVMLPFWDETDDYSLHNGVPTIFTQPTVDLPSYGLMGIPNPLRSFTLPISVSDNYWGDQNANADEAHPYYKRAGYTTVRYPLSGLVGNFGDAELTYAHNQKYPDPNTNDTLLNNNIMAWLNGPEPTDPPPPEGANLYASYRACLFAPNYVVFSNTTSAAAWNANIPPNQPMVVALEDPHNDLHLAVGGFDAPQIAAGSMGLVSGSNGDMGENNTSSFDPIFFFHHCNIDRVFWLWQKLHGQTTRLEVSDDMTDYPGTSSNDLQGPTPGVSPGAQLTLDGTALKPFKTPLTSKPYVSTDCVDIENQLGYTYGPGSFDDLSINDQARAAAVKPGFSAKRLMVRGIDRALFQGSFLLTAHATVTDAGGKTKEYYLGYHSVLSRYSVSNCANCRTHLEVIAHFPLKNMPEDEVDRAIFTVKVHHRGSVLPAGLKTVLKIRG